MDPGGDPHWTIAPIKLTERWFPGSEFSHKAHQNATCESCHNAGTSMNSADIAMPTIVTCQGCHVGNVAVLGKIRSTCELCHSFHQHKVGPHVVSGPVAQGSKP